MHKTLMRQLRRLHFSQDELPQDLGQWRALLQKLSDTYADYDNSRYTLERSLQLSSAEMRALYDELKESSESRVAHERALLRLVTDAVPDVIYYKGMDGVYLGGNKAFDEYTLVSGEIIGRKDTDLFPPTFASELEKLDRCVLADDVSSITEECWVKRGGQQTMLEMYRTPFHDASGQLVGIIGIGHDITRRKRNEENLKRAAIVFENISDGVMISDKDNNIIAVNRAFTQITGYSENEVLGKNPRILKSGQHDRQFYESMWRAIVDEDHWEGELLSRKKNGELNAQWMSINRVLSNDGEVENYVGVFSDITQIKESRERFRYMAQHDPLTDLPNRALFTDRLRHAIQSAERNGEHVALLFMDLDRFKNVNDTLGHPAGDNLLRAVARRLMNVVRESDTVARIGGDEFVVVLTELADGRDAAPVAQKILEKLSQGYNVGLHEVHAPASIGISVYPDDGRDAMTMLKHADSAMYRAKEEGGNNYQFYTRELTLRAFEHFALETTLRNAVERAELELHYQPQFDRASGKLVGAEALLRWRHPGLGLIGPTQFIPLAEETGLITKIGEWALNEACSQVKKWRGEGFDDIRMAVNLSGRQILHDAFIGKVISTLERYEIERHQLTLELTETFMMHNSQEILGALKRLEEAGVNIAIDDFGTGYSSMACLQRMDVNYLKIDKSFIHGFGRNSSNAAIVNAIISMAHSLGVQVVAEGVETENQRDFLNQSDCDELQGFLLGRPVSGEVFTRYFQPLSR